MTCKYAIDEVAAIEYILDICGKNSELSINKSSTVKELIPGLRNSGIKINDTYSVELELKQDYKLKPSGHWDIPKIPETMVWESLSSVREAKYIRSKPEVQNVSRKKVKIGLLGVNSASAESCSIYLVQHLHNITKLIENSDKLFFIIGLEKILETDQDAIFQARCCGLFGLENILIELFTHRDSQDINPPGRDPKLTGKLKESRSGAHLSLPPEIHLILLDNGRTDLAVGKFKRLLECIGCKSCSRMCPRVKHGSTKGLEVPTNPRDILLSGFTCGLKCAADYGLFECTTCGNCESLCPVDIPIPDITLKMRELCMKNKIVPEIYKRISENIEERGNPYLSK
jgi:L-lactate utilization protein LutB